MINRKLNIKFSSSVVYI